MHNAEPESCISIMKIETKNFDWFISLRIMRYAEICFFRFTLHNILAH